MSNRILNDRPTAKSIIVAAIFSLLTFSASQADEYYKWVDAEGVTHYTEKRPSNVDSIKGETRTGHSEPSQYSTPKASDEALAQQEEAENLKDPERCQAAKSNLTAMKNSNRIKEKGEDGKLRYLSQDEIADRKKVAQQAVKESC